MTIFVFYKGYIYEDELGSRKIATVPRMSLESLLVFLNVYRNESASVQNYCCTFHPVVFRVSYFHKER
jgi:hypothetical protein